MQHEIFCRLSVLGERRWIRIEGTREAIHSRQAEGKDRRCDVWSTFIRVCLCVCVCVCVCLLRVSGVAELSRPDPKMNDDGEGDDVWVELFPVQLVDTHRAGFLVGERSQNSEPWCSTHSHAAMRQPPPSFNHLLSIREITNNLHLKDRLSQECNERSGLWTRTTVIKRCPGRGWANFWRSYRGGDWQATCPPLTPKSQLACQAFCEIRGRRCSIRRDELRGRWLEARAHLDISRARSSRPAYKLWFESERSPDNFDFAFKAT